MAWGPGSPDYYGCQQLTGAAFENVFCQTLWAAYAKMLSYYIFFTGVCMMVFVLQVNLIRRPQAVPLGELYLIQVSTVSNATHTVKGRERIQDFILSILQLWRSSHRESSPDSKVSCYCLEETRTLPEQLH